MEDVQRTDEEFFGKIEVKTECMPLMLRPRRVYPGLMCINDKHVLKVRHHVCNKCHATVDFEVGEGVRIISPSKVMECPECGNKDNWWGMCCMEYGGAWDGVIFIGGEVGIC